MRFLVADDNLDAVESLAVLLEMSGHEVRTAVDGGEAVSVASGWPPDVAILDLQMPVLDGYAVAAALRAEQPDIVLVALSGQIGGWNRSNLMLFDLCFSKGVGFRDLLERLNGVLLHRQ